MTKSSIMLHGRKVVTSGSGMSTVPPVAVAVTFSLASPKQLEGEFEVGLTIRLITVQCSAVQCSAIQFNLRSDDSQGQRKQKKSNKLKRKAVH